MVISQNQSQLIMKYTLTGSSGNITKPLAEKLLEAGHEVTVISRNDDHLKDLYSKGAKGAIGNVEDVDFLTEAFKGVDAVYTMIPPNMETKNWKEYIASIGKNLADAVKASGVKNVINLSSVGAHSPNQCGPVSGLYYAEKHLNNLDDVNIIHLRPGFFYTNYFSNMEMIVGMGILGSNYPADLTMILTSPDDIAEIAFQELSKLNFSGHTIQFITSDLLTCGTIAATLGEAIAKPDLKWVAFSDDEALNGLKQAGLPDEIATNYMEMGKAVRTGIMNEEYNRNRPIINGKIKLQEFAKHFAQAYNKMEMKV